MGKTFKEELKEIWADEYIERNPSFDCYHNIINEEKSLKEKLTEIPWRKNILEGIINFARYELFYPKLKEIYDFGGTTGSSVKGSFTGLIANLTAGGLLAKKFPDYAPAIMISSLGLTGLQYLGGPLVRNLQDSIKRKIRRKKYGYGIAPNGEIIDY